MPIIIETRNGSKVTIGRSVSEGWLVIAVLDENNTQAMTYLTVDEAERIGRVLADVVANRG